MRARRVLLFAWLSCWLASTSGSLASASQGAPANRAPMPPDRAKATFEDERVRTFLAVAAKEFGGKCAVPAYTKTEAAATQRGGGDLASSFYEISVPCPGKNGLVTVEIRAEFATPLVRPLDLVLSLTFRQ